MTDYLHPSRQLKLAIYTQCQARMSYYVLVDIREWLYIFIAAHRIHTHPPPPPAKTPLAIINDMISIIRQMQNLGLTARKFLLSTSCTLAVN